MGWGSIHGRLHSLDYDHLERVFPKTVMLPKLHLSSADLQETLAKAICQASQRAIGCFQEANRIIVIHLHSNIACNLDNFHRKVLTFKAPYKCNYLCKSLLSFSWSFSKVALLRLSCSTSCRVQESKISDSYDWVRDCQRQTQESARTFATNSSQRRKFSHGNTCSAGRRSLHQ